jgi:hypothetical protein
LRSEMFYTHLTNKAKTWWNSRPVKGIGVDW